MDDLLLELSFYLSAPTVHRALSGVPGGISNPQGQSVLTRYTFGASGTGDGHCDQFVVLKQVVNPSSTATIDLRNSSLTNVVGETGQKFTSLKEFWLVCLRQNADGTSPPSSGLTAAVDAALATALGLSGAVTFTTPPGDVLYRGGRSKGATTGGSNAVLTLGNTDPTLKATWLLAAAGFR